MLPVSAFQVYRTDRCYSVAQSRPSCPECRQSGSLPCPRLSICLTKIGSRLTDNFRRLEVLAQGATIFGTDLLTLCSGTRDQQDMWTYHPQNQSPAAWQEMIEGMQRALDIAMNMTSISELSRRSLT